MSSDIRLFLTSMCADHSDENPREMIEPIKKDIDGVFWVLNDVPEFSPSSCYLESVKGCGKIIHRSWPAGRHHVAMNDTLYTGIIQEGDFLIWTDALERPVPEFVKRIKTEFIPFMNEIDADVLFYYGKAYLIRYRETLEYRNTPHWSLTGWNGKGFEYSQIEPDESKVRLNVRPIKRAGDPYHWCSHYARYYVGQPAGSNTVALGLDHFPPGDRNKQFAEREERRLRFRKLLKNRGYDLSLGGLTLLFREELDEEVKFYLRSEKILSDYWHLIHGNQAKIKDSHNPADAVPIE